MDVHAHWQSVYQRRASTEVSWYQPAPTYSLAWITQACPDPASPILDVGAGASRLVDRLLALGYHNLTVLDVAEAALDEVKARLGDQAARVTWVAGDVLDFIPPQPYALWHDRAVLHFLREPAQQQRYAEVLRQALAPGGHALIATFAKGGPTRCSGLDIVQHDAASLQHLLGADFEQVRAATEMHRTPAGSDQLFHYALFVRVR